MGRAVHHRTGSQTGRAQPATVSWLFIDTDGRSEGTTFDCPSTKCAERRGASLRAGALPLESPAVAAGLGVPGQAGHSVLDSVASAVASQHLLLVLDNCEHLLDGCAGLVHELLTRCPNLHVLTTSREPLGVTGERAWPVPSLSLPVNPERVTQAESVQLFVDRLVAVVPSFALAADNTAAVAEVCVRL